MADALKELDSAILLVRDEVVRLRAKAPEHELLKFAENFDSGQDDPEFLERFGKDHIPEWARETDVWRACLYMNYYNALRRA